MTGDPTPPDAAAVYDATARRYVEQIGTEINPAFEAAVDRAVLGAFTELVASARLPVGDIGCGPGRIAAHLAAHHIPTVGIDPSAEMIAQARAAHPALRFEQGRLPHLSLDDDALSGAVCWYSIIHTPPSELGAAFTELRRVLVAGGNVLVAFQAGRGEVLRREDAHGSGHPLVNHRHDPDVVSAALIDAGFQLRSSTVRAAEFDHETTPQAFLIARSGDVSSGDR